jgi:hypothetical protein
VETDVVAAWGNRDVNRAAALQESSKQSSTADGSTPSASAAAIASSTEAQRPQRDACSGFAASHSRRRLGKSSLIHALLACDSRRPQCLSPRVGLAGRGAPPGRDGTPAIVRSVRSARRVRRKLPVCAVCGSQVAAMACCDWPGPVWRAAMVVVVVKTRCISSRSRGPRSRKMPLRQDAVEEPLRHVHYVCG